MIRKNQAKKGSLGLMFLLAILASNYGQSSSLNLKVEQLTSGGKHHFFGYIGQCRTIPWNESGRYILGLEVDSIHRMPYPAEAAKVFIVDTKKDNEIIYLDETHAWNHQQGCMFYWNPSSAETQFFSNDRDLRTGKVFTVLYDIKKKKRIKVFNQPSNQEDSGLTGSSVGG